MNSNHQMHGRIVMITGANSGIGKATAMALATMGATVVMVCRDQSKGEVAQAEIVAVSDNQTVDLMKADLSSQKSIHQLAADFRARYPQLHVLINNAGVNLPKRTVTVDGVETQFAVNHLAPFLLTNLLLDVIKASAPSRIINLNSVVHTRGKLDFDNLQGEKRYRGFGMYSQTKLANMLFTYELARRLEGTSVTVNALHPGPVRTNLGSDYFWMKPLITVLRPLTLSPEQGAETSVFLASSPEVESINGKYFVKKKAVPSSKESYDEAAAKRLWQISEELTKL